MPIPRTKTKSRNVTAPNMGSLIPSLIISSRLMVMVPNPCTPKRDTQQTAAI